MPEELENSRSAKLKTQVEALENRIQGLETTVLELKQVLTMLLKVARKAENEYSTWLIPEGEYLGVSFQE